MGAEPWRGAARLTTYPCREALVQDLERGVLRSRRGKGRQLKSGSSIDVEDGGLCLGQEWEVLATAERRFGGWEVKA